MNPEKYTLTLTFDELIIIHNSLNEVCNGLPTEDFQNRIGLPIAEVEKLFDRIKGLDRDQDG